MATWKEPWPTWICSGSLQAALAVLISLAIEEALGGKRGQHRWCLDSVAVCYWHSGPGSITKLWKHVDKKFCPLFIIIMTWQTIFGFMKWCNMKPNILIFMIKLDPYFQARPFKALWARSERQLKNPVRFRPIPRDCGLQGNWDFEIGGTIQSKESQKCSHWTCATNLSKTFFIALVLMVSLIRPLDGCCKIKVYTISRVNGNSIASWATVF
jgi:hypothetical protein